MGREFGLVTSVLVISIASTLATVSALAQSRTTTPVAQHGVPPTSPVPAPSQSGPKGLPITIFLYPIGQTPKPRSQGSVSAMQVSCYGQTDQPHRSTHLPGSVNVIGRTVCDAPVIRLALEIRLYHYECWWQWWPPGWVCNWVQKTFMPYSNNGLPSIQGDAAAPCEPGDWGATTVHWVTWPDGYTARGSTGNWANIPSC